MTIRSPFHLDLSLPDLKSSQVEIFLLTLQEFLRACLSDPPRIYMDDDHPVCFALSELQLYKEYKSRVFENVNDALIFYIFHRLKFERQQKQIERIKILIEKKLNQLNEFIDQLSHFPDEQSERMNLQKRGELLLAHLNRIPAGTSQVEIPDLFDVQQNPILIPLDPTLSAQENAQRYFQKAREVSEKIRKRKEKVNIFNKQKNNRAFQRPDRTSARCQKSPAYRAPVNRIAHYAD